MPAMFAVAVLQFKFQFISITYVSLLSYIHILHVPTGPQMLKKEKKRKSGMAKRDKSRSFITRAAVIAGETENIESWMEAEVQVISYLIFIRHLKVHIPNKNMLGPHIFSFLVLPLKHYTNIKTIPFHNLQQKILITTT